MGRGTRGRCTSVGTSQTQGSLLSLGFRFLLGVCRGLCHGGQTPLYTVPAASLSVLTPSPHPCPRASTLCPVPRTKAHSSQGTSLSSQLGERQRGL